MTRRSAARPVRNREYVTDARGFLAELATKCVGGAHLDAAVTQEDGERLTAFLRGFGDLQLGEQIRRARRARVS